MNKERLHGIIIGVVITCILTIGVNSTFAQSISKTISVVFNQINIVVDGTKVNSDNILYNGTTYVPLRTISEMLDKEVKWDGVTNTASINSKKAKAMSELEEGLEYYTMIAESYIESVKTVKTYVNELSELKDISDDLSSTLDAISEYQYKVLDNVKPIKGFDEVHSNLSDAFAFLQASIMDMQIAVDKVKEGDIDGLKKYMNSAMEGLQISSEFYIKAMDDLENK